MTGLAFAVHPIHCESVAGLVGRAELGMALHILLSLLAYRSYMTERELEDQPTDAVNDKERCINRCSHFLGMRLLQRITVCWFGYAMHTSNVDSSAACQKQREHRTIDQYPVTTKVKWKANLYLMAALSAATCAIFWKETGITAVPLCAIMELTVTLLNKQTCLSAIFTQV